MRTMTPMHEPLYTPLTIPAANLPPTPLAARRLRIYVAAPLGEAHVARMIGARLIAEGYDVVSRWTDRLDAQPAHPGPELLADIHRENQHELNQVDLVVAWTAAGKPRTTFGEIAWALSRGIPVVWLQDENGAGGNAYDTDHLVTVLRRDDYSTEPAWSAILAAVAGLRDRLTRLDAEVRAGRSELAIPPAVIAAIAGYVRSGESASFADLFDFAARFADVTQAQVTRAVKLLCALGVLEATDPGPNGAARWRRRSDLVEDLQRENARLRDDLDSERHGYRVRTETERAEIDRLTAENARLREQCAALRLLGETPCEKRADETMAAAAKRWALSEAARSQLDHPIDGQPLGVAVRGIAAGENVIAGLMVAPVQKAAPTLHLTADEAAELLTGSAIVYRPIADLPPGGHMQALRDGSWEWSPDGGFDRGVVAVPCPWGESGARVLLTEPWRSWEERCDGGYAIGEHPEEHVCSAHCHQVYVAYLATPRVGYRPVPDKARITYLDESTPIERNRHLLGPWQPAETMPTEYMREPAGRTVVCIGVHCVGDGWQWIIRLGEKAVP